MFADIVSNGKYFVNLDPNQTFSKSNSIKKLYDRHKPVYFDDFFDIEE